MLVKENQIIRVTELAKLLGVTDRHLRNLANEGIIKKTENGKYLFLESVQGYIEYLELKNDADVDLKDEKIKEKYDEKGQMIWDKWQEKIKSTVNGFDLMQAINKTMEKETKN